ncbi:hyphal wall protein 1-like isoform X2 [Myripristis murdjan]|uniref:hyphal wall protein 1-like isoform X2 n=1 Tax=Myripristis murdjan TaxID=586833 RepID=UPI001175FB11|nr:hyphal wall protein 1-like isoform X2 [Myripristis murdjan]
MLTVLDLRPILRRREMLETTFLIIKLIKVVLTMGLNHMVVLVQPGVSITVTVQTSLASSLASSPATSSPATSSPATSSLASSPATSPATSSPATSSLASSPATSPATNSLASSPATSPATTSPVTGSPVTGSPVTDSPATIMVLILPHLTVMGLSAICTHMGLAWIMKQPMVTTGDGVVTAITELTAVPEECRLHGTDLLTCALNKSSYTW